MRQLVDSVLQLPSVGPKTQSSLASLGIETVYDLLTYYPFRYEDIAERPLHELKDQEKVVLKGYVVTPAVSNYFGFKKNQVSFRMKIDDAVLDVRFFNQPYLKNKIKVDQEIAVYGRYDAKRKRLSGMKIIATKNENESSLKPVYHVNKQIRQSTLVKLIKIALDEYGDLLEEILPANLVQKYQLVARPQAIWQMHFPTDLASYKKARARLTYEEFLLFELQMQNLRQQKKQAIHGQSIKYDNQKLKAVIQKLPFELTADQKKVTNEICHDLLLNVPMNRLLQGDVGSGKTIVAALVMYAVTTAHKQAALMVPTEILAEQHYQSLVDLFADVDVEIALLTGSTKKSVRTEIAEKLANGSLDILIGTHALIQDNVEFNDLGLIVIDEQHRFGVKQRKALKDKGLNVDVLMMTATPIPRTLAITAYGEMDVSMIKEMPKGRLPIQTRWLKKQQLEMLLEWSKKILATGQQMYVICPLIEESEAIDAQNAEQLYEELQAYYEPNYHVGLLHGKMKAAEKEVLMHAFQQNELQILVSTTVIEVGVNVPNATLMLIMDADRFGLAQLHQLRGRVGRGQLQSYCYLIASPKNEVGEQRMQIMTQTTDGFVLSQKDLEMRGPGEFFGHRQSGVPQFKIGDIIDDYPILESARQDAVWLVQNNYQAQPENQKMVAELQATQREVE